MQLFARLDGEIVAEIVEIADDLSITDAFHPSLIFVACDETTAVGMRYADGAFAEVEPDPPTRAELLAYAAEKRWRIETGGITVAGASIDTSRDSQAMITGAYAFSQANPEDPIKYKAASGWVTLDAATMAAIATAVGSHVQASFAAEEAVDAAILAGTITTVAGVDAADWPSNGA